MTSFYCPKCHPEKVDKDTNVSSHKRTEKPWGATPGASFTNVN